MKSTLLSIFAVLAILAFSIPAQAETKIAVVNIQKVMQDSTAAKSVREQLKSRQGSFESEMKKKEEDLRKQDQELSKQRSVLAPDAFEQKLREFREKASAAQKDVQAKKNQLDKAFGQALNDIQKSVFDIVGAISKEKGLNAVIPTSQMLYADPALDITGEVTSRLNKQLPNVSVKF
jgi:Skp family chaperone for outer membrane proteins